MKTNKSITILYVDDEEINLFLFDKFFSGLWNIFTASSGSEGLEILEKHPEINFIFSDMNMPVMNGLEFIRQVKLNFPSIPCSIISGYSFSLEMDNAIIENLIKGFFQKPYTNKDIIDHVEKGLNLSL